MGFKLAPWATVPKASQGRYYTEDDCVIRSPFQRDRDRIVHSTAFRRMKHKTQVFVSHEGDHFRTRLTHSLEVAQIARSVCRSLGLEEDLAEALALAHDLGHTPFGHAGERALNKCLEGAGGFDHNEQTLRILTKLEQRYALFDGLNLTWETLEGVVKHNGPLTGPHVSGKQKAGPGFYVRKYNTRHDLALNSFAGPEAQIAAMSDDIAYNTHDIDDGLRAGLFTIADVLDVPLAGPAFHEVSQRWPDLHPNRLTHEALRRVVGRMISDLRRETASRIAALAPQSVEDIRAASEPVAAFSEQMVPELKALRQFLFARMYRHYRVNRMGEKAKRVVTDLFGFLVEAPDCLPTDWSQPDLEPGSTETKRLVGDYIAGMTDNYALDLHRKLFNPMAIG